MPILHDESQSEHHLEHAHLEQSSTTRIVALPHDLEVQRKRMLMALGILLLALAAVIVKDWDFWFPSRGDNGEIVVRNRVKYSPPQNAAPATPVPPVAAATHERKAPAPPASAPAEAPPMTATTQRTVLPPLDVEVVAGNQHVSMPAKTNAIRVDVGTGVTGPGTGSAAVRSNAPSAVASGAPTGRVQLSPQIAQRVSVSVPPDYPLLARQMKVQGAVSLQALIARDGTIQELQILSGPDILATAAREAVKQWHFKPYLQNGQPVETQARITVNFTISTN